MRKKDDVVEPISELFHLDNIKVQPFDTLQYTKQAMAVGFTQEQSEFQAEKLAKILDGTLVTKTYLKSELNVVEDNLRHDIDMSESRLRKELASIESKLKQGLLSIEVKMISGFNKIIWTILGGITTVLSLYSAFLHFLAKSVT